MKTKMDVTIMRLEAELKMDDIFFTIHDKYLKPSEKLCLLTSDYDNKDAIEQQLCAYDPDIVRVAEDFREEPLRGRAVLSDKLLN